MKFKLSFYDTLFLCLLLFFNLFHCCLLNNYISLLLIHEILSWFVHLIYLSVVQLLFLFFTLGNGLSMSKFDMSNLVSTSSAISFAFLSYIWFYIIISKTVHYSFTSLQNYSLTLSRLGRGVWVCCFVSPPPPRRPCWKLAIISEPYKLLIWNFMTFPKI